MSSVNGKQPSMSLFSCNLLLMSLELDGRFPGMVGEKEASPNRIMILLDCPAPFIPFLEDGSGGGSGGSGGRGGRVKAGLSSSLLLFLCHRFSLAVR